MSSLSVDLLVVGWGKAGKTLAGRFAAEARSVALVERSPSMYGGACINVACVPTKDLVVSAEARRPDDDPATYFSAAVAGRDELVGRLNLANHGMLEGKVTLLDGTARFTGPKEVTVSTGEGEVVVTATNIAIGTGTAPARLDIPGIGSTRVHDSTTIQHIDPFPARLAVIGGGFIGLELASMFQQFGSRVTVLEGSDAFLPRVERDVSAAVHSVLTGRGVDIRTRARVQCIEETRDGVSVVLTDYSVEADAVLVAVGRTPAAGDLDLAVAGVATDERGFVVVDDQLRTSVPGVFAVGDVNGGPQFTYISLDDYRIVWDALTGEGTRRRSDRVAVPTTTFITPPLSQVGLSPTEAREAGHEVLAAAKEVANIAAMPRPKILGETEGLISCTVDARSREILGATLFCVDSQELVNLVALAMRLGATVEDLRDGIWTHPSSTEAFNEVLSGLRPFAG